jgi:hypothetical protein
MDKKDIEMMDLWFKLSKSYEFIGIYDTKKELAKNKANDGSFGIVKGYKYVLSKQPYYKTKNWIKMIYVNVNNNKGDINE